MSSKWAILMALLPVFAAGCGQQKQVSTPQTAQSAPSDNNAGGFAAAPSDNAGAQQGDEKKPSLQQAVKEAPSLDPACTPYQKKYAQAEALLKSKPGDPSAKKAYVLAAYNYAYFMEYTSDKLEPSVRYRAALLIYRDALKVDPSDKKCSKEKSQIDAIYKSMPGGIPQS